MPSGRPRLAGSAAAFLGAWLLAGCTGAGGPAASSGVMAGRAPISTAGVTAAVGSTAPLTTTPVTTTPVTTTPVTPGSAAPAGGANGIGSVGAGTMTPIPEASGCTTRIDLGDRTPVRPAQLWPGASELGSDAVEVTARPGVSPCRGDLPAEPDCALSLPWAGMDAEDLARETGATRVVSGQAYARVAASSDSSSGTMTLTYAALSFDPASNRLAEARAWFDRAVEHCGLGGPGVIAGVPGLVGERHKPTLGPGYAGRFLVATQGAHLVSLLFDGGTWSPSSRDAVVRVVVPLLATG